MDLLHWLRHRKAIDRDLDAEIRHHFEMAIADRVAGGEDPESARLAALNEFGNVLQAKENARQVWRGGAATLLVDFWQDVRFALRMLIKHPAFSLVVIAVLTLGIAGNAALFSLFKGIALKPLPGVRDSATSAVLLTRSLDGRGLGISIPDYRDIAAEQRSFEGLTASMMIFASLGRGEDAQRIVAELVTGNYFEALGVGAQLGRTLLPSDDVAPGQHPVAVISDSLWQRAFAAVTAPDAGDRVHVLAEAVTEKRAETALFGARPTALLERHHHRGAAAFTDRGGIEPKYQRVETDGGADQGGGHAAPHLPRSDASRRAGASTRFSCARVTSAWSRCASIFITSRPKAVSR